jgi:hypothetical protein
MTNLSDALAERDIRDTAQALARDDRAGFWQAMHPVGATLYTPPASPAPVTALRYADPNNF